MENGQQRRPQPNLAGIKGRLDKDKEEELNEEEGRPEGPAEPLLPSMATEIRDGPTG